MLVTPRKSIVEETLGTFYLIDHNKSSQLNAKGERSIIIFGILLNKQRFNRYN